MWASVWANVRQRFQRAIDWDQVGYLGGFLCAGGVFLLGQRFDPNFSILFHDWDNEAPWVYPLYVALNAKCGEMIRGTAGAFRITLNEDGHRLRNVEDRLRNVEANAAAMATAPAAEVQQERKEEAI
jgi:hypothetical protein